MERIIDRHHARLAVVLIASALVAGCALLPSPRGLGAMGEPVGPQPARGAVPTATPSDDLTAPSLTPTAPITFTPARKWRGPFTLDLYRPDAHVPQFTASWCVGSSMQMMINLMEAGRVDRTRATQRRMYRLARQISPWIEDAPGAGLYGWSGGLEQLGYGAFEEIGAAKRQAVLRIAARRMRLTNKPVGLWVWRGKHAWVMSGFKATRDPAVTADFRVTAVWVEDPWSGRVSSIWGPGLGPHTLVSAQELGQDFRRWSSEHRPEYGQRGMFTVLVPAA